MPVSTTPMIGKLNDTPSAVNTFRFIDRHSATDTMMAPACLMAFFLSPARKRHTLLRYPVPCACALLDVIR